MERSQVLEHLKGRIATAGGTLVANMAAVADEIGIKPERLYYLLTAFEREGQIVRQSSGRKGTEIRLVAENDRGNNEAATRRTTAVTPQRVGTTARFCPWCGRKTEPDWRFCASCGQALPTS